MRRRHAALLLVLLTAGAIPLGIAPAGAIETTTFGIDVNEPSDDQRLHIDIEAGETATGEVRVWNKQDAPLTLTTSVAPARIDDDGRASLGGDEPAVDWVSVEPATVELAPKAERVLRLRVDVPRKIDGDDKVLAVLVQPSVEGEAPAVLQRLALTTILEPDEDSLIASLGPYPWIAAAVLAVVAASAGRRALRRPRPER